jgi:hypothetical protein
VRPVVDDSGRIESMKLYMAIVTIVIIIVAGWFELDARRATHVCDMVEEFFSCEESVLLAIDHVSKKAKVSQFRDQVCYIIDIIVVLFRAEEE